MASVTVILRGGLGNQMFQYAAGFALAREAGAELVLDTTFLKDRFPRRQFTYRNYDLDVFALQPSFTQLSKISSGFPVPGVWLGIDLAAYAAENALGIRRLLKEKQNYMFDPSVLQSRSHARDRGSVVLWGRWQTEKYFIKHAAAVRAAFRFRDALMGEAARLAGEIEKTNSASIHVRRGDYLLPVETKTDHSKDASYYERAIAYIAGHIENPSFFIFSDDIAWCREHIKPPFPTTYVDDASCGPKDSFHLHLMSLCKHNIIANSSFSWWGAWLNGNLEKIVIAPKQWESRQSASTDIIPEDWIAV